MLQDSQLSLGRSLPLRPSRGDGGIVNNTTSILSDLIGSPAEGYQALGDVQKQNRSKPVCTLTVSSDFELEEETKTNGINLAYSTVPNIRMKYVTGDADLTVIDRPLPGNDLGFDGNLTKLATVSTTNIFRARLDKTTHAQYDAALGTVIAHEFGH